MFMDKNLFYISLTKSNKLNRIKSTFLITQFKNKQNIKAWYITFALYFQHGYSLPLAARLICNCFRTIFLTRSPNNVLWIVCAKQLKIVCFYMMTFIYNVVTLIFCVLAEQRIGVKVNLLMYNKFCLFLLLWLLIEYCTFTANTISYFF